MKPFHVLKQLPLSPVIFALPLLSQPIDILENNFSCKDAGLASYLP